MKLRLLRILSCLLSIQLMSAPALAQSRNYLGLAPAAKNPGAEYVSGRQPGTVLMKVNLWGAVNRPGIHHIPVKTDLMSLVSYAGGPLSNAILDEVTIKREVGNSRKLIRVNVDELIRGVSHHHIELAPNDVVVIPTDKPLIDQDTVAVVGLVSIIMSTILTAIFIERNSD